MPGLVKNIYKKTYKALCCSIRFILFVAPGYKYDIVENTFNVALKEKMASTTEFTFRFCHILYLFEFFNFLYPVIVFEGNDNLPQTQI